MIRRRLSFPDTSSDEDDQLSGPGERTVAVTTDHSDEEVEEVNIPAGSGARSLNLQLTWTPHPGMARTALVQQILVTCYLGLGLLYLLWLMFR